MCIVTHLEDYTVIFLNSFSIYNVFFWGHVLGLMFPENDLSKLILTFPFLKKPDIFQYSSFQLSTLEFLLIFLSPLNFLTLMNVERKTLYVELY